MKWSERPTRVRFERAERGGCITRRWEETLELAEGVIELIADEPTLIPKFESLHDRHGARLPRLLPWGETVQTVVHLDAHRTASMLTSCVDKRGLRTSCWVADDGRGKRGRR